MSEYCFASLSAGYGNPATERTQSLICPTLIECLQTFNICNIQLLIRNGMVCEISIFYAPDNDY